MIHGYFYLVLNMFACLILTYKYTKRKTQLFDTILLLVTCSEDVEAVCIHYNSMKTVDGTSTCNAYTYFFLAERKKNRKQEDETEPKMRQNLFFYENPSVQSVNCSLISN